MARFGLLFFDDIANQVRWLFNPTGPLAQPGSMMWRLGPFDRSLYGPTTPWAWEGGTVIGLLVVCRILPCVSPSGFFFSLTLHKLESMQYYPNLCCNSGPTPNTELGHKSQSFPLITTTISKDLIFFVQSRRSQNFSALIVTFKRCRLIYAAF